MSGNERGSNRGISKFLRLALYSHVLFIRCKVDTTSDIICILHLHFQILPWYLIFLYINHIATSPSGQFCPPPPKKEMAIKSITKRLAPLAILGLLLYAPPSALEQYLGSETTWPTIIQPLLKTLLGLGALRALNAGLNALAQNNWHLASPASSKWDWPQELAVVTGGCGGLGLSLVAGLTARGVRVAVLDIVAPEAIPTVLKEDTTRVQYFQCDITSLDAVKETAVLVRKKFDGQDPSILINNAGVANRNTILDVTEPALRRVLGVNLMAMWFTTQQFLPAMVRQNKGHIFTVASLASFVALPASIEYSATKAGALAFHEGLACEIKHLYKARGVVTSVVHPNFVKTPMTAPHAETIERAQKMLKVEDVTGPMLEQIFSGKGAQIVVPRHFTFLSGLRGWPSWIQEGLRDALGSNQ